MVDMEPIGFGKKIKSLLIAQSRTQKAFAAAIGVNETVMGRWIREDNQPDLRQLHAAAVELGVSADYLINPAAAFDEVSRVGLTDGERQVLDLARRLGTDEAINRLIGAATSVPVGTPAAVEDRRAAEARKAGRKARNGTTGP